MRIYIILGLAYVILVAGCRSKEVKALTEEQIIDLVKLYQQGAGADDIAGQKLKNGGEQTKSVLIKLLDNPTTPQELSGTIMQILHVYFPSDETYNALDRFAEKIKDPLEREKAQQMMKAMRSMPRER
jgi:site-specific recombinase